MTPEFIKQFLGDANRGMRQTVANTAFTEMKARFACQRDPRVRESMLNALRALFPSWYIASFVSVAETD